MQNNQFSFDFVPPVFKRGHHVMIALFDEAKTVVHLSRKNAYPEGIYRLFGGGVDGDETTQVAVFRELKEETGLRLPATSLTHKETFQFLFIEESAAKTYGFTLDLFYGALQGQSIIPGDDVNEEKAFTKDEFKQLLDRYATLPTDLATIRDSEQFRWSDYGKAFLVPHQYVFDNWPTNN